MSTFLATALAGFSLGFSLILAIGPQNAFVLRQGLRRSHVFAVALTCALSDAVLITVGVTSFATIAEMLPAVVPVLRYGGAAFLFVYGARAFLSAWRGGVALSAAETGRERLWPVLLTCLALTWGNPHVYLDTVVLLGSVSARFEPALAFGLGAVTASFVFFFGLAYAARALAPHFARPAAWRLFDLLIGGVMWAVAAKLAFDF
ncbi:LysE family transporter [Rhodobacterales bacterium HKCCE3408]|nr:LysE family transporter [Rhodobacterales bacterium HKCCE3408]